MDFGRSCPNSKPGKETAVDMNRLVTDMQLMETGSKLIPSQNVFGRSRAGAGLIALAR